MSFYKMQLQRDKVKKNIYSWYFYIISFVNKDCVQLLIKFRMQTTTAKNTTKYYFGFDSLFIYKQSII